MRIDQLLTAGRTFSFELFPARTGEQERVLEQALEDLIPLRPAFVSITYGAGGSTRDRTHDLVLRLLGDGPHTPMAHLTCIGHSREELAEILLRYRDVGLSNLLALRGDGGLDTGDLRNAAELVELARELGDFCIGVAAHPEGHPETDLARDHDHLAAKLRLADFAITQFLFETDSYPRLVDDLAARGVEKPVIPGIMPVTNLAQVPRFAALSGRQLPAALVSRLEAVAGDPDAVRRIGVAHATLLCEELLALGVPGLHFYTLNRSRATREIYTRLTLDTAAPRFTP